MHEENIPTISKIEKHYRNKQLSVYFCRKRTSHFLTRDLVTLNKTLSISHSPRPLAAEPIRNTEIMESLLAKAQKASQVGGKDYSE